MMDTQKDIENIGLLMKMALLQIIIKITLML